MKGAGEEEVILVLETEEIALTEVVTVPVKVQLVKSLAAR